jgi:hypothetical protein
LPYFCTDISYSHGVLKARTLGKERSSCLTLEKMEVAASYL